MNVNLSKNSYTYYRILLYPLTANAGPFNAFEIQSGQTYSYNGITINQPSFYWYSTVFSVSKTMQTQTLNRVTQMGTFYCGNIGNTESATLEVGKDSFGNNSVFIGYQHYGDSDSRNRLILGCRRSGASIYQTIYSNVLTATCGGNLDISSNNFTVLSNIASVGINTTSPRSTLHVVGNCIISGNVNAGSNTLIINANSRSVGINRVSPNANLHVVGNCIISSNLSVDSGTFTVNNNSVVINGNCEITDNLAVGGYITDLSGFPINGIDVIEAYLPGYTPWPTSDVNYTLMEIVLTDIGVWQLTARLALSNDGSFIDLYYVAYGVNTSYLSTDYFSPMAPFQDLSYEMTETVQVSSVPRTVRFQIRLIYDDPNGSGLVDEIRTQFTAVRLGDLSGNPI